MERSHIPAQRIARLAERIHGTGPRPLAELLREVIASNPALLSRIERYAALDPTVLNLLGADRLVTPLHEVRR